MANKDFSTRIKPRWTLQQECFTWFGCFCFFCLAAAVQGKKAELLLKFNNENETFEFNQEVLNEFLKLPSRIRVIAFLGDANIGRSTTLNTIIHILSGSDQSHIEEIFPTDDTVVPVTRDVQIHIIHPQNEEEDIFILLEVQGVKNVGEDASVYYLSLFAALISSDAIVFVQGMFDNNNLHFLSLMSRLRDRVFPGVHVDSFVSLRVVIRDALRAPDGQTIEDFVRDFIVEPTFEKNLQKEREAIAKYFQKDQISVSPIPHAADSEVFRDARKLSGSDYGVAVKSLAAKFKEVQVKKSSTGLPLDGKALVKHAEEVIESINKNSLPKFGNLQNLYEAMKTNDREKVIKYIFSLAADKVEDKIDDILGTLKKKGVSESEINTAKKDLQEIVKVKRKEEEIQLKLRNAVDKHNEIAMQIEENEEKFPKILAKKDEELAKERKAEENAEKKVNRLEQQCEEQRRSIRSMQEEPSDSKGGWFGCSDA